MALLTTTHNTLFDGDCIILVIFLHGEIDSQTVNLSHACNTGSDKYVARGVQCTDLARRET